MNIGYFYASKHCNGAMVVDEFKRIMTVEKYVVNAQHTSRCLTKGDSAAIALPTPRQPGPGDRGACS
jgi:hypothetical protein